MTIIAIIIIIMIIIIIIIIIIKVILIPLHSRSKTVFRSDFRGMNSFDISLLYAAKVALFRVLFYYNVIVQE